MIVFSHHHAEAIDPNRGREQLRTHTIVSQPVSHACVALKPPVSREPEGRKVLRSIDSAGTLIPLFADFTATMTESDSSSPFVSGSVGLKVANIDG